MTVSVTPLVILLTVSLLFLGVAAYVGRLSSQHGRRVRQIPIRIHVNGTRGKSTVTRLIAAGFRESGYRTIAKTTGSASRLILPDASEVELQRAGAPSISEQLEIIEFAGRNGADVLVIECMAVIPELQAVSQHSIVHGTCSVVTNARLDHQDVMGETVEEIAWSLGAVAPRGGVLVTAEQDAALVDTLAARAATVGARVVQADLSEAPTAEEFGRAEWPDNLALALRVCALHGIDRETALRGMRKAPLDPGALFSTPLPVDGCRARFVNAFAANDYTSTEQIIRQVQQANPGGLFLLVNARADRPRRTQDMAALLSNGFDPCAAFLIGDGASLLERLVRRQKPGLPVVNLAGHPREVALERIAPHLGQDACLVGIGNIGGPAEEWCAWLATGCDG